MKEGSIPARYSAKERVFLNRNNSDDMSRPLKETDSLPAVNVRMVRVTDVRLTNMIIE
ncbi:MAG: hypothetical protein LBO81_00305 [Clostridiales Family XIII bacterium]|nr:hypothetical protein [Clostridiales Family XIII bacterium]